MQLIALLVGLVLMGVLMGRLGGGGPTLPQGPAVVPAAQPGSPASPGSVQQSVDAASRAEQQRRQETMKLLP